MSDTRSPEPDPRLAWLEALRAAQAAFPESLPKTGKNTFHGYEYVELEAIVRQARPILAAHGLVLTFQVTTWDISSVPATVTLRATLAHVGGHAETFDFPGISGNTDKNGKLSDKAVYAAVTGARKYALMSLFGLAAGAGDDPEHDQHERPDEAPRRAARPPALGGDGRAGQASKPAETPGQRAIRERREQEAAQRRAADPPEAGFGPDEGASTNPPANSLPERRVEPDPSQLPPAEARKMTTEQRVAAMRPAQKFTKRGGKAISEKQYRLATARLISRMQELGDAERKASVVLDRVACLFGYQNAQELGHLDLDPLLAYIASAEVLP